jgi:hypothetical protein
MKQEEVKQGELLWQWEEEKVRVVEQDANQERNKWADYFYRIRKQCPWSLAAWNKGEIDIVDWTGEVLPLSPYQARVYRFTGTDKELKALAKELDYGECEWLYSFPGYGPFATPEAVLIQQDRAELARLRNKNK